jgi:hypothetical protein
MGAFSIDGKGNQTAPIYSALVTLSQQFYWLVNILR